MRNFFKLAEGVNVQPLMHSLVRKPHLWNQNTLRTKFPQTPFSDIDDILLRFSDPATLPTEGRVIGDATSIWHPAANELPEVKPLVMALMHQVGAWTLDRLLVTRLRPGGVIQSHRDDEGEYVNQPGVARYHIVLQGAAGSNFICGEDDADEVVNMQTGEVWWFDAHKRHSVENGSDRDRIHLLVDVRTW